MSSNNETTPAPLAPLEAVVTRTNARKLYEISAMVTYAVVVAAASEKEALAHVETWEQAWASSADLVAVSDIEVIDVREPHSQDEDDLEDEAHEVV